mmetsp:Transcript_28737/g.27525  ORF Transcript_28737/g.27525 Transcript_28737/m.27525 type:complete len:411 (+) Transcript_28737:113-1345(+)|eukprot:CAMPEP_0119042796 /NCGR_PEP_ID=MMETSP1177-20130426/16165_1 /TAXON_ID=2985 /ORGANISM="Ochromonas sp, Strain CCMP1899" /LENGTH=410 /DNA_ID=CAMNT_0007009815 /DNA_START=113 /DNA_END=1345 /DNA_ORIENTATION=+
MFRTVFKVPKFQQSIARVSVKTFSSLNTSLYSFGIGSDGQLGHAKFEKTQPSLLNPLQQNYVQEEPRRIVKSKEYKQVAIGTAYTLLLSETGHLFGCGKGFLGAIESKSPQIFPGTRTYSHIAAGPTHCAAIDMEGQVYTWGNGGSWLAGGGQLGHNNTKEVKEPKLVEGFREYGARALSVSVGKRHTLIQTTDGEILSCGVGEYGRVGDGNTSDVLVPRPVETLLDEDIVDMVAGFDHSLALTSDGKIFSWGKNDSGALGHGDSFIDHYALEEFPRLLECLDLQNTARVVQLAAGQGRSAAITEEGKLFLWGRTISPAPLENSSFDGLKVLKVAIGGDIRTSVIAILTEDGGLWTFGDYNSRMLGNPALKAGLGKQVVPVRVPAFIGKKVLDVYCGSGQHMIVKVEVDL